MNKLISRLTLAGAALCAGLFLLSACNTPKLESGGAYAPTNSLGQASAVPDLAFLEVDQAYDIAHAIIQGILKFELDNRQFLWNLSPEVKHSLDAIRPDIVAAERQYDVARKSYKANPTPDGLGALNTILAQARRLAISAQAATANLPQSGNQ